jgi:2-octaprenylphenol hydroxylase
MHNEKQCGIVWSTTPEHAEVLLALDMASFNLALQEAFDYTLGEVVESENRAGFALRRAEAERYCEQGFVLIGDAAHSVHPLAGQGANLGLLDAASLAQLVLEAKSRGRNIASRRVLRAYERWRKGENKTMMMTMEGFKYIFENQSSPVPMLRNKALDFANSFNPLKHIIMRHAIGLSGDLPLLAKNRMA